MKKIFIHFLLVGIAVMVCACNKSASLMEAAGDEIDFRIGMSGPRTKVNEYGFQIGDQIGLWAVERSGSEKMPLQIGGNYINNEPLTLQDAGDHWRGSRTLYWSTSNCDFYGLYPYQNNIVSVEEQPFSVALDQTGDGFVCSDLLWANADNVAPRGVVNMQFRHILSKLTVVIVKGDSFEGELPSDVTVHIYNTSTTGKVNLQNGSIEKDAFAPKGTITAKKIGNQRFETIVIPQYIEKKTPLVEVTMGGIAYLLEYSISLRPGYEHTIWLTVNTSPDQEMIEIGIDAEQGGWN